jgi:DNA-binding transcriptional LysR family regulator
MGQIPKRIKMQSRPFLENILEVVASPKHPLSQQKDISLKDLSKERFLVREKGSGTRKAVGKVFSEDNIYIKPYMELGDTGAIKNAVMANLGIAVLSRHAIKIEHDIGKIAILNAQDFPLYRHWYAVYPREKSLSLVTKTFLDFLMTKQGESNKPINII